jgi:hypothetical protein
LAHTLVQHAGKLGDQVALLEQGFFRKLNGVLASGLDEI